MTEPVIAYDYMFPVVGGEWVNDRRRSQEGMLIRQVYGTAFCLAESWFITNEHVLKAASQHSWWGMAFTSNGQWRAVPRQSHLKFS